MAIENIQDEKSVLQQKTPFFYPEMALAHRYCVGQGIEIGAAAHNPFNLPGAINIAPFSDDPQHIDYRDFLIYKDEQVRTCGQYARIDLVGEAHALPAPDKSQDYVLSSHVVEHLTDLIRAFLEWNRVLKADGIVFIIFPKRDALVRDSTRQITPLEHFVEDYHLRRSIADHPFGDGHGVRGHYHVFTLESMLELIQWCNLHVGLQWRVEAIEATDSKVGNGHTVVCRFLPDANATGSQWNSLVSFDTPSANLKFLPAAGSQIHMWQRVQQLTGASRRILRQEGVKPFVARLYNWLRGERRYHS